MKISDLEYMVSNKMRCHVYRKTDVKTTNGYTGAIFGDLEYKNDIFDDYSGGIRFGDLQRYKFVWNASINFIEPKNNSLFIVLDLD